MTKRLREAGPFWTPDGIAQVRRRTKLGTVKTWHCQYRAAWAAAGAPSATAADNMQLGRDVPKGRHLGGFELQRDQGLDRGRVGVQ